MPVFGSVCGFESLVVGDVAGNRQVLGHGGIRYYRLSHCFEGHQSTPNGKVQILYDECMRISVWHK